MIGYMLAWLTKNMAAWYYCRNVIGPIALHLIEYKGEETYRGPFKFYVTLMGVGGGKIFRKKRYEGVMFNVISVTRGWVGVQFPEK